MVVAVRRDARFVYQTGTELNQTIIPGTPKTIIFSVFPVKIIVLLRIFN